MAQLTVRWQGPTLAALIGGLASANAKRAASVAMRRTALLARKDVIAQLDDTFTLRRKSFLARGIRTTLPPPNPATFADVRAEIGTVDPWLAQHDAERGSDFLRPPGPAGYRAAPIEARETPTMILPPSKWPGRLIRRKKAFLMQTNDGRKYVIEQKGAAQRVLYRLTTEPTPIPSTWPMVAQVRKVAKAGFPKRLSEELQKAVIAQNRAAGRPPRPSP